MLVVVWQYVPGKSTQSALDPHSGTHVSPALESTHAFGKPRTLSPLAPTPAQSLLWAQARVHHAPLHVSPAMHVPEPELHGSPVPDSAQMVHRAAWHDAMESRSVTPPGYCCWHALMHDALALQPSSQLTRLTQAVFASQVEISGQQLAARHWTHFALPPSRAHAPLLASSTPPLPPPYEGELHATPGLGDAVPALRRLRRRRARGGQGDGRHARQDDADAAHPGTTARVVCGVPSARCGAGEPSRSERHFPQ